MKLYISRLNVISILDYQFKIYYFYKWAIGPHDIKLPFSKVKAHQGNLLPGPSSVAWSLYCYLGPTHPTNKLIYKRYIYIFEKLVGVDVERVKIRKWKKFVQWFTTFISHVLLIQHKHPTQIWWRFAYCDILLTRTSPYLVLDNI